MPSKQEIIKSLSDEIYKLAEVKMLVNSVSVRGSSPIKFKKGDMILSMNGMSGTKVRPLVIIKVLKDTVITLSLSTTNDYMTLIKCNSRFVEEQYISKCLNTYSIQYAKDNYIGVLDDIKSLNKAIKLFKEYVLSI